MKAKDIYEACGKIFAKVMRRKDERAAKSLERDCNKAIQLTEFDGQIFISYYDTPLVCISHLSGDAVETVKDSRRSWVKFQLREMGRNTHPQPTTI